VQRFIGKASVRSGESGGRLSDPGPAGQPDPGVQVDVQRVELEAGDVVLLCTDGLTEMVSEDWIAATLAGEPEPEAGCAALVAEANARGGRDNITAVVARFEAG
jgi:serine/threonine protein phosphatase PrpC